MFCRYFWGAGYGMPLQSIEYCYSLEELFQESGNIDSVPALSTYGTLIAGFKSDDYWKTGTGYKLWTYIYYTYRDHICVYADKEINPVGNVEATRDFWKNFYTVWNRSHIYYEKLIELQAANEAKFLDQIASSTESENRFNDTPDQSGDYSTADYTSNITKAKITSKTDGDTVLGRLEEVRRRFTDFYRAWANEFKDLFISPLNYQSSDLFKKDY